MSRALGYAVLRPATPDPAAPAGAWKRAIVFVHGIFSSHETFDRFRQHIQADARFGHWEISRFDYDFHDPILANASRLAQALEPPSFVPNDRVTLVCHSMGGLVARFAAIGADIPCLERIVMLGTPNFGSLSASQFGALSQMVMSLGGEIWTLFSRKPGILDLRRIGPIFEEYLHSPDVDRRRAERIEYVTVPGTYYHRNRPLWEGLERGPARMFTALRVGFAFVGGFSYSGIDQQIPHDGIVEESSVCMIAADPSRVSEKTPAIQFPHVFQPPRYAHVVTSSANSLTHVEIQSDPAVIRAVLDILHAGSAHEWLRGLTPGDYYGFNKIDIPGAGGAPAPAPAAAPSSQG